MSRILLAAFLVLLGVQAVAAQDVVPSDGLDLLVADIQTGLLSGSADSFLRFVPDTADRERAAAFTASQFTTGLTRVVVRLRDRAPLRGVRAGEGYRLLLEIFLERGRRGRIVSWRVDVRRAPDHDSALAQGWTIVDQEQLVDIDRLYRLELDTSRQFDAQSVTIVSEDLTLRLPRGAVFVAETDEGITALVLLGEGEIVFAPKDQAERGQLKIFSGLETLRTPVRRAFIRLNPYEFEEQVAAEALVERPAQPADARRALETFNQFATNSFTLELGDLSQEAWSLVPAFGDFLAELDTRQHGLLTYARAPGESEDISLFDRRRKKNISLYASRDKLATRGFYYDESDQLDYDVVNYSVDVSFEPERQWIRGRTRLRLRADAGVTTVVLRLAESLAVATVVSDEVGRLTHLRVRGRDSIVVNLGTFVPRDTEFTLTVTYEGRLEPQPIDREALAVEQRSIQEAIAFVSPEPHYLYSNRSYWYPQSLVSDYATAAIAITLPDGYGCVGSGRPAPESPISIHNEDGTDQKRYVFVANQPARYLAFVVSRFTRGVAQVIDELTAPEAGSGRPQANAEVAGQIVNSVNLVIEANPRQVSRSQTTADRAADMIRFYTSLVGDSPYPSVAIALTESDLPGGHSPAHLAMVNNPVPGSQFVWWNDPVSFDNFPQFFLAHEVAHQWWGQAVGWKNYHEQWLSEGFAQYFALLYARHSRGEDVFNSVLRQMRRWALEHSARGPVYLGYRVGHLEGQGRIFRAVIYNKGALVLHMLRLRVGDEAFFRALRRFYATWRFRKAGTDDLRQAFESETQQSLDRFFQGWIHDSRIPHLRFRYYIGRASPLTEEDGETAAASVVLRFEQDEEPFDVPVPVTLNYQRGDSERLIVNVRERVSEARVPLKGELRSVDVNRDGSALARIDR